MRNAWVLSAACLCLFVVGCEIITLPYHITKGAVQTAVYVVKGGYELTAGTTKVVYRIGKFTYKVVRAPSRLAPQEQQHRDASTASPPRRRSGRGA